MANGGSSAEYEGEDVQTWGLLGGGQSRWGTSVRTLPGETAGGTRNPKDKDIPRRFSWA